MSRKRKQPKDSKCIPVDKSREWNQNSKEELELKRQELRWRLRTRISSSENSRRKKCLCGRAPVKCLSVVTYK